MSFASRVVSRTIAILDSLPTPGKQHRGVIAIEMNTGSDDAVHVGRRLSGGTYEWYDLTTGVGSLTTEAAQDAVGGILVDSTSIDFTYSDATPSITAAAIFGTTAGTVAEGNHTHAQLHDAVTVVDTASIDITLFGQQISAAAIFGTGSGVIAEGNHTHSYQPLDADLTTIAGLAAPGADRLLFWDHSALAYAYLTAGSGLTITGTTIEAAGGSGLTHPQVMSRVWLG